VFFRDMYLYSDPEMQFLQSVEAVEYIQKQLGWDEVAEDFEFLEDNSPTPSEEVTVDLQ
jgi:hypothetical protein